MMLKQTVESPDRKAVLYPGGKNSAVQLGSYQEMVFHRNRDLNVSFEYRWDLPEVFFAVDLRADKVFTGDELAFQARVGIGAKEENTLVVHQLRYELLQHEELRLAIGMERKTGAKSEYKVEAENYSLIRNPGRVWHPGAPVRFYGFPDEVVAYHQNANFVQSLNLQHEKLFRLISYLGPLRTRAERLYSWTGIEPESVGYAGENTVAAILAARQRKLSFAFKQRAKPFKEIIARQLKEMDLIEAFKVNAISKQRQEYEVKLRTKGSTDWVDLPDVGFGISQVLPVLVQCLYAPPGSIILMEQPEIHLHPSAQSALADVMIQVVKSREDGSDRNVQLIIETHSEHFLRRLQRRIAEDVIDQEQVSAYFANIGKTPTTLEPLVIDTLGNIRNWPENFFGDEMGDITKQARAAMKKRAQPGTARLEVRP